MGYVGPKYWADFPNMGESRVNKEMNHSKSERRIKVHRSAKPFGFRKLEDNAV